jgi:hypothetical protein
MTAKKQKVEDDQETIILGADLNERLVMDNYSKTQKENLIFQLTDEELVEYKDEFYQVNKLLNEKMNYLEGVKEILMVDGEDGEQIKKALSDLIEMAELSEVGIKTLKKKSEEILSIINKEFIEKEILVFYIPDYDNGLMYSYAKEGKYIGVRTMEKEEQQFNIKLKSV